MIAVTVTGDNHFPRPRISLFYYYLVANAPACGVEVDPVLPCECFNLVIFGQVGFREVLDIMVQGKYRLARIRNSRTIKRKEFRDDRSGVIMRHTGSQVRHGSRKTSRRTHTCSGRIIT